MPHYSRAAGVIHFGNLSPIQIGQKIGDLLTLDVRLQAEQTSHSLVEVEDFSALIYYEHTILDRIEQRFQEASLPGQSLDNGLQPLRIQPPYASQHFVKKTGLRRHG